MEHKDTKPEEQLLMEVFGTYDKDELIGIADKAKRYDMIFAGRSTVNTRNAGRKSMFSDQEVREMEEQYQAGASMAAIAQHFHTSRQTISKYIAPRKRIEKNRFLTMRLQFMFNEEICTTIDVDFKDKKIFIQNHTNDIIHRAFGVLTNPTWDDFQQFLNMRCFPETRANLKDVLRDTGVPYYDPLQIIEKTQGRMAEDKQWLQISYPQRSRNHGDDQP